MEDEALDVAGRRLQVGDMVELIDASDDVDWQPSGVKQHLGQRLLVLGIVPGLSQRVAIRAQIDDRTSIYLWSEWVRLPGGLKQLVERYQKEDAHG